MKRAQARPIPLKVILATLLVLGWAVDLWAGLPTHIDQVQNTQTQPNGFNPYLANGGLGLPGQSSMGLGQPYMGTPQVPNPMMPGPMGFPNSYAGFPGSGVGQMPTAPAQGAPLMMAASLVGTFLGSLTQQDRGQGFGNMVVGALGDTREQTARRAERQRQQIMAAQNQFGQTTPFGFNNGCQWPQMMGNPNVMGNGLPNFASQNPYGLGGTQNNAFNGYGQAPASSSWQLR